MYYYKLSDKMTPESIKKLMAQAPSQAAAIILAVSELQKDGEKVSEDAIIDHISSDLARFSPRAKDVSVVPGFVAYYRAMLGKLPSHIMEQTKDNIGNKPRGGGKRASAESMVDPITGETMENVFKRAPVKNPGARKTRKIVTEEILGDEDDEFSDEPDGDLEAAE